MHRLAMLLKSHGPDLEHAGRLVASFRRHNASDIPLYIVVPATDLPAFAALAGPGIEVLDESALAGHLTDEPVAGIRPGYINQEIVKLAFWELGLAANYFCVDSDAVFIRDFTHDDFMFDAETPYTVLVEDNELMVEPRYYEQHGRGRQAHLRRIQELVGLDDRRILTCHGHQVFSSRVLASLTTDFMEPRGWTYVDMLAEAPYEFSWYNMWLQKSRIIPIEAREPLVKVFHHEGHHLEWVLRGVTPSDAARGYVAVVVNSNFANAWGSSDYHEDPADTIARYAGWSLLARAATSKARSRFRRG